MSIATLQKYYRGFFINRPIGNNIFSYHQRENKRIYVAPMIAGGVKDLAVGNKIVFSEVWEGQEINQKGLKQFIYLQKSGKDIFIFDNHNHAFFFWSYALAINKLKRGSLLVHVDQHTDMREPPYYLSSDYSHQLDLQQAFQYSNETLNVGNFIQPALQLKIFSEVEMIDSSASFQKSFSGEIVLDIDIDIFSEDMAYIDDALKIRKIKNYLAVARVVTIASSPYFMDQLKAIEFIKALLV